LPPAAVQDALRRGAIQIPSLKKIFIYAKNNIQPGVELAYDYKYEWSNDKNDVDLYKCECGSRKCRGTIMKPKRKRRRKR